MNRSKRKTIAEQTLQIIDSGGYGLPNGTRVDVTDAVRESVDGTRMYTPDELEALLDRSQPQVVEKCRIEVRNETTLSAARRMVVDEARGGVLCLNFASAKNPGGGFLGGSQAQEESLARSSALYTSLTAARDYYEINRRAANALYTDHMILSPRVPVFRDDSGDLLEAPYPVCFVTAPAVNAGALRRNRPELSDAVEPTMRRRIGMLLALAAGQGYRSLILGAWGCGVFKNDPAMIARLFNEYLCEGGRFSQCFELACFAVLDSIDGQIIGAFENVLERESVSR